MPTVRNGTVYYVQHPTGLIEPGTTTKYVEEQIDLDNAPLDGGVLVKVIALSSDPYMRYRMRAKDDNHAAFSPQLTVGCP